ncbi:glycoside hydrolase family 43 protein [Paenibacillus lemnae]|uniref:Glycosyl hydrolase 43 family protein n=1 Tax=Paenibacillus lemnae TaxID=1330551 RepID=A0A848M4K8_PAELE|nr:glycoside hydrolase 43 family protein [Paenibacillus lemnae]NMO95160.1 glycosyl hydrolase 43 family protein [Paenibacillus lemnae]
MKEEYAVLSKKGYWGDQGDGTYVNPVLPGDYSDPDVIKVGDDYYGISSTLHCSPGMAVLHSKDLVNWSTIGHVVNDLTRIGPDYRHDVMNRYGKGVWAGAIRFHQNKYWVYFFTPDEGLFMSTAADPAGPWEPLHCVWEVEGWDDCCPFWDDDGQGYLVATHFADNYKIHLFQLSEDGKTLLHDSAKVIHQYKGSEASKLYKINGSYYLFHSEIREKEVGEVRVVMMLRSKHIYGPYEEKELIHTHGMEVDREPNQGGLVQTPAGEWYFISHQGTGGYHEGRTLHLLPVTWVDGWPIIGEDTDGDGIGEMVWGGRKPIHGYTSSALTMNDDFESAVLKPHWEWNHQPKAGKWSLTERHGYLRLYACVPSERGDFFKVCNTIAQRAYRTVHNKATVKIDLSGMVDDQEAGLCHFAQTFCTIGIQQQEGTRVLKYNNSGIMEWGPAIDSTSIWLRSVWNLDGESQFEYSVDGDHYISFGGVYQLGWGNYRGDRIGIYGYNHEREQGYIDVESFFHESGDQAGPAE